MTIVQAGIYWIQMDLCMDNQNHDCSHFVQLVQNGGMILFVTYMDSVVFGLSPFLGMSYIGFFLLGDTIVLAMQVPSLVYLSS